MSTDFEKWIRQHPHLTDEQVPEAAWKAAYSNCYDQFVKLLKEIIDRVDEAEPHPHLDPSDSPSSDPLSTLRSIRTFIRESVDLGERK